MEDINFEFAKDLKDALIVIGKGMVELAGYALSSLLGLGALSAEIVMLGWAFGKISNVPKESIINGADAIGTAIQSLGTALADNDDVPELIMAWLEVIKTAVDILPGLAVGVALGATALSIAIVEFLGICLMLYYVGDKVKQGIVYFADVVLGDLADALIAIVSTIGTELAAALTLWGLVIGIGSIVFAAGSAIFMIGALSFLVGVMALYESINAMDLLSQAVTNFFDSLFGFDDDDIGLLEKLIDKIIDLKRIVGGGAWVIPESYNFGSENAENISSGFSNWFNQDVNFTSVARAFTDGLGKIIYEYWDIHSPSRRAMRIAKSITEGFTIGILSGQKALNKVMTKFARSGELAFAKSTTNGQMQKLGEKVVYDLVKGVTSAGGGSSDEGSHNGYGEAMANVAESGTESFVEATESGSEEMTTAVEGALTSAENVTQDFGTRFGNNLGRITGGIADFFGINMDDVNTIKDNFGAVFTSIKDFVSGDSDISSIGETIASIFPDAFGDSGTISGNSFITNFFNTVMGAIPGLSSLMNKSIAQTLSASWGFDVEAGELSRVAQSFERLSGYIVTNGAGNFSRFSDTTAERMFNELYNQNRSLFENDSRFRVTDENGNVISASVKSKVLDWLANPSGYGQSNWETFLADFLAKTPAGGNYLGSDTSSILASDTQDALSRGNVVNSNNTTTNNYNYTQNNYSPEALDRIDIYRQTELALGMFGAWDKQ